MKFLLAKCAWGTYVDTMLTVNLPSLLAAGNLPALATHANVEHLILTTPADAAIIDAHPVYRALKDVVPCRIECLPIAVASDSYSANIARMNEAHKRILAECAASGAAWLFDQPDHVWGRTALSYLARRAEAGVRCVMFAGIRTVRETMVPALSAWRHGQVLDIPHRALIGLATENFHAHDMVRFWGAPVAAPWAHHVNWRVGPHSFLRRSFYPQPFLIAAPDTGVAPSRSVDEDFVDQAYPDSSSVEFAQDTDDFAVIEVSPRLHVLDQHGTRLSVPLLAAWIDARINLRKREYFSHAIRFRGDATKEARWRRVEIFAARVATTAERFQTFHSVHAALGTDRPALATLLGRLLRDRAAHRFLTMPDGPVTLLIPGEDTIRDRLDDDISALAPWVADHLVSGDQPLAALLAAGRVTTLGGWTTTVGEACGRPMIGDAAVTDGDQRLGTVRVHWLTGPVRPSAYR